MKIPQTTDQQTKVMEDFKIAHLVFRSAWGELEDKPYSNNKKNKDNNNNNKNNDDDHHHHIWASDCRNQKHIVDHVGATDHRPNRITSTTTTTSSWQNDNSFYDNSYKKKKKSKNNGDEKTPSSWINDAEVKRQKRIVKYKAYAVEGKVKASFRNGFRWVKEKYCEIVYGY